MKNRFPSGRYSLIAALIAASLMTGHADDPAAQAIGQKPVITDDPVRAFVHGEYPAGDDYFAHGNRDTYIFRCRLARPADRFEGVALSEISIWGNRAGPWEIFRKEKDGNFVHIETKYLTDTSCLENCRTKEYLSTGRCRWEHGWPKP